MVVCYVAKKAGMPHRLHLYTPKLAIAYSQLWSFFYMSLFFTAEEIKS